MNQIEVENLNKVFKVKEKPAGFWPGFKNVFKPNFKNVEAVKDISFGVKKGEIIAFIGPNGAGKSTTIKMMTGILHPTSGKIRILGLDPDKDREKLAFQVGAVFGQKSQLWFHLPAIDSFDLLARIYELDKAAYQKRRDYLVNIFEIEKYLKTPVRKLSLGERMRCEIVASLLHQPKILFLDEPTIGLDIIAKQKIREVITKMNKEDEVTIFLTSHDAGDVESLAERTIVINFGKIVYDNQTDLFKKEYIKTKTIEIVFDKPTPGFHTSQGRILEKDKYNAKIELDQSKDDLNQFLKETVEHYNIKDINIFDPSMEDIIGLIYQEKQQKDVPDAKEGR
ncbi:MAG: ATP-binding cassette domain-containing protein [Candidatus Berkelbacteria bacterium]|nr:ATP-binding cassette domain-containing protein [Candidatus Berkelbacteria bacterium]